MLEQSLPSFYKSHFSPVFLYSSVFDKSVKNDCFVCYNHFLYNNIFGVLNFYLILEKLLWPVTKKNIIPENTFPSPSFSNPASKSTRNLNSMNIRRNITRDWNYDHSMNTKGYQKGINQSVSLPKWKSRFDLVHNNLNRKKCIIWCDVPFCMYCILCKSKSGTLNVFLVL